MPGVASADTPDGQPCAFQWTVGFDRFDGVLGTGRPEATVIPEKRADRVLVGFDHCQYQAAHFFSSFNQSLCKHFLISSLLAAASGMREINTMSNPLIFSRWLRKKSLITRFARLRPTAVFICFFEIASPRRENPSPFGRYSRINAGSIIRRDSAKANLKSFASVSLDRRGKAASTIQSRGLWRRRSRQAVTVSQAVSRTRPFARRALNTRRPPRVFILARNPWVRLRFRLLG